MTPHTKIYMNFFGYKVPEDVSCEYCGRPCTEIHHLVPRSIAPKHKVNLIDNLCGLCREHHERAHNDKAFNEELKFIHRKKLLASKHDSEKEIFYDHTKYKNL